MAAVQKPLRIVYNSRNFKTGLTDVKANVYVNGAAKAVGSNALALTELDSTNAPGQYELLIPAATLTGWGVAAGQYNVVEGMINSASNYAPTSFRSELTVANTDDVAAVIGSPAGASVSADIAALYSRVGAPAGASVSADIASLKADTVALRADLETGANSLAVLNAGIQAFNNGVISNGVGYVMPNLFIPPSGSNTFQIPITINNNDGTLVDPTGNIITVGVKNSAGADRGSYLSGSSGSPAVVNATRNSVGQYLATVVIPAGAPEEQLIFSMGYQIGSNPMVRFGVAEVLDQASAEGAAQQATLVATQTTVNAINAIVGNATSGNVALYNLLVGTNGLSVITGLLNNSTFGLAQLLSGIQGVQATATAISNYLANSTFGLPALQANQASMQGTGFVSNTDSLHALSQMLQAYLYVGGTAR